MQLLIYASPFNAAGRQVLHIIRSMHHGLQSVYLHSIEDLEAHLKQPARLPELIVLIPGDQGEVEALIAIGHLLRDARVVLVLPDDNRSAISKAHLLRPRFVGHADGNPTHLNAVICKMLDTRSDCPVHAAQ